VLHRIMVSGSDRACEKWMTDYDIPKIDQLALHHFYRAMAWLGEELDADQQAMLQGPPVLDGLVARSAPLRTGIPARKHSADGDRRLTPILRQSRWNCYCKPAPITFRRGTERFKATRPGRRPEMRLQRDVRIP
jgi:hypothetical protein